MDIEDEREEIWEDAEDTLRGPRKQFKIIGKKFELIQGDLLPEIHGALDFTEDRSYIGVPIQVKMKKEDKEFYVWKTGIITSERELIMLDGDVLNKGTGFCRIGFFPKDLKERWARNDFYDFLGEVESIYSFEDIYNLIREQIVYYMDLMDDREYDLVTAWIMMTYFYPMFNTLPIIYLNAIRTSGKTKLLMLMAAMSFSDGTISPNISASAFFRTIEANRSSCFVDENERIGRKEKNELKELLNACYKKGAVVKRSEEVMDYKGVKNFQVRKFNVFAPLALASIYNIDDVLESRCVRITLQRTYSAKGNTEVNMNSAVFSNIRNGLFLLTLKYWKNIKNLYDNYVENVENEANVTPLSISSSSILPTLSTLSSLSNRELEMWKPLFVIAKATNNPSIFKRLYSLALDKSEAFREDNIAEEANTIVLDALLRLVSKDDWYKVGDLTRDIQALNEGTDWLKPKFLSNILKTLGLGTSKRRFTSGVSVFITIKSVREAAKKVGLNVEEILKETGFETATNQVEKLDVILGDEEKIKAAVIAEATAAGITNPESKIQQMINQGLLIEPRSGYIKKVG